MNNKYFIGLIVSIFMFLSCEQNKEVTYSKYSSVDNSYSVEIPSSATRGRCVADFMSFENENSHLIIAIEHINEGSIKEYMSSKNVTNNTFSYDLLQSSDTTSFYKIKRGNNMWAAYDLYMLKCLNGKNFLIKVSSDVLSQSEMIETIKHIYSSMKLNELGEDAVTATEEPKTISLEKTYSTKLYSIKYPKGWKITEHLDEITEVYIGYQPDNFGFTIVRFETDYTLSKVNAEGNKNARQAGFIILEDKQMTVDGQKCHRTIQEISIQGQKAKLISYTFKKGNMLYNIKFGTVRTKAQEILTAKIIDSFHF